MLGDNLEATRLQSGGMTATLPDPWPRAGAERGNRQQWMQWDTGQALRDLDLQRQAPENTAARLAAATEGGSGATTSSGVQKPDLDGGD